MFLSSRTIFFRHFRQITHFGYDWPAQNDRVGGIKSGFRPEYTPLLGMVAKNCGWKTRIDVQFSDPAWDRFCYCTPDLRRTSRTTGKQLSILEAIARPKPYSRPYSATVRALILENILLHVNCKMTAHCAPLKSIPILVVKYNV